MASASWLTWWAAPGKITMGIFVNDFITLKHWLKSFLVTVLPPIKMKLGRAAFTLLIKEVKR